jgi:hypothetical protein
MYTNVFRGRLGELAIVLVCMAVFLLGAVGLAVAIAIAIDGGHGLLIGALALLYVAWLGAAVSIADAYIEHLERRSSAYWAGKGGAP